MKHKMTTVALLFLSLGGVFAQRTVSTTGNDVLGTGGSISYSVGQTIYTTNTGTTGTVSQGVQQPYEVSTTVGVKVTEINLNLIAYPNPTSNSLTLSIGDYNTESLTYQLFDISGRLLDSKQIMSNETQVNLQDFPMSTYFVNILDKNALIKTFRIVKN
jgi:hypothetical protein